MPLDRSFAGRQFPPTAPYQVGREKIREFARAIGADDAAHHDPTAARALGYPDVLAPPTFPVVVTSGSLQNVIDDPDFGLDFSRVVHGEQRFVYRRPVVAGDELVCTTTVDEIVTRAGNDLVHSRTEVTTVAGEPVVTVWAMLVVRGEHGAP